MAHLGSVRAVPVRLSLWLAATAGLAFAGPGGGGLRTWGHFDKLPYPADKAFLSGTFPPGFMWAVGTAAYQVEGASDKDGKGPSIWDTFTRGGKRVARGDVGSDSYHNAAADVRALRQLGVGHYRFSLSWPRIFPDGTRASLNPAGVRYYHELLARLREAGVEPVVTLYHWDLPEALQRRLGGWSHPRTAQLFRDYADFCFRAFGEHVKWWITIDNPFAVARHGYGTGVLAPGIKGDPDLPYRVGRVLLQVRDRGFAGNRSGPVRGQGPVFPPLNGSRGGVAHLRPRLPAAPRRPRVDGAGLALGAPQPHPPGEPARVPVLPGARAGLVRLAALRRRRLPGLHEGPPGRPPAGPRRRRAAAAAGGRRLLRPVSQRRAQLPAGQRQPQVRSAGGPGPAHAALLGQRRVRPARHLRGAERMVRVGQHQDPGPQAHVLLEEVHRRGPEIRGGGRREVAGLHGVVSDGRLRVAPRVRHPAGPLLRGLQHTRHEAGAQDLGRLLQVGAPGGGRRRRARSDNGETCWRLFPGRRNVIRRNGFPELPENRPARGVFPCDFAWGVSANSIQVESSPSQFADRNVYTWNVDNGELTRLEGPPAPPSAREAHCADYVSIGQQVDEIQAAGVNHFHFSLNWSALVPTGEAARPNATLLGYYRCFSRQLLRANVTPVVTLWHHTRHGSSLPAPVDGANRWLGGETPDLFADYARLCFRELGRHVKMWITLNEPNDETVSYQEAHQMLRAHALAWRAYDRDFRAAQGGQVSLALHMDWVEPAYSFSREDVEPAKRVLDFRVGWFAQPVFGDGDYPLGMRSWLRQLNSLELPAFKEEDRSLVRGTYDFFAISHFSTELVTHAKEDPYTYTSSLEVQHMIDTTWILSPRPVVPWGLRKALNWVKERYPHVPIYVMANGVQEDAGRFKDSLRVFYLYNYINEALKAFTLDGVNLKGYFAYALDDQRDPGFGLYGHVHHEAVAKASLANYRNIIRHDGFPAPGAPDRRRRCPAAAGPAAAAAPLCPGCGALAKRPVVGFLTLVCSAALVATGLVVYYASRPRKSAY
ncbi:klotho isoform X2 [Stigmatopora argus]